MNRLRALISIGSLFAASSLLAMKGIVVTGSGDPLTGARVEAFATYEAALAGSPIASATTGANGAFTLDLKTDSAVLISTSASGHVVERRIARADADDVVIELPSAEMKNGTVRSAKGPLSGVKITVVDAMGDLVATYETDDHGHFSMPDPKRWASGVCAQHPDYATTCHWVRGNEQMMPQPVSLEFMLDGGRLVSGHVLTPNGKPAANAKVSAGRLTSSATHDDGSFALRLSKEEKTIRAIAGDLVGTATPSTGELTITLVKGRTIAGSVRDEAGHALGGARVVVQEADESSSWMSAGANARGEYLLGPLAAGNYSIYVQAPEQYEIESKQADLRKKSEVRADFVAKKMNAIRGVVRDENRQPVFGAVVLQPVESMPLLYAVAPAYGAHAITGTDGTFRLYSAIPKGKLTAIKAGFAAGRSGPLTPATIEKPLTITLPRGLAVKGTVIGPDKAPVSGASVIIIGSETTLGTMPIAASLTTGLVDAWVRTDANGVFSVQLNPGMHDFGVWKSGFASRDVGGVEVSESMEPLRITLDSAVSIRGRVTRKGGTVESGVVFAVEQMQRGAGQAQVGSNGEFAIDSLPRGTYTLQYIDQRASGTTVTEAPATGVVIELPETIAVRGRVTDASGAPVRQFNVSVQKGAIFDNKDIDDPNGEFVQNVAVGESELRITATGYRSATRAVVVAEGKEPQPLNISLAKGRRITGHVVSKEGKPVAEAGVSADDDSRSRESAMTDEEGEYELEAAPLGAFELSTYKEGYVTATKKVAAGGADQTVDITLDKGLTITGRVVDKSGAPVEEAQVSASGESNFQSTTSDKSGAFTISGLTAGHVMIVAAKTGLGQAKQTDVDVNKPGTLLLTLGTSATGTIRGSIVGSTSGWMMAMIQASNESGDNATAAVGRDGKFVVENTPAGEVKVRGMLMGVQRQSSTKEVKVVVPAGGEVEVQLAASAGDITVRGTVKSGGAPLAGSNVMFSSGAGDGQWSSQTGADGSYEVSGLEAGRYDVMVYQFNGRSYSTATDVMSSTTFDINATFVRIEGRVVDDRGAGIEGASVSATRTTESHSQIEATTDATGAFALDAQGDLAYRIAAKKKTFAIATVDAPAGSTGPFLLQLHPTAGAHVRLVDSQSGATLDGFVVVRDETGRIQFPTSGDREQNGSLLLPLPEGSYRVSASASEYASQTIKLSVPSGETTIALSRGGTLVVSSRADAHELIKLVMPNGEEYVRCYCNGIAEIRLSGATTRVDHVAAGAYRMQVIDEHEVVKRTYSIVITEGQTTTVDATK